MDLFKKLKWIFVIAPLMFSLTSCGTLFCTYQTPPALTITCSVPDAEVYIDGRYMGTTPYSFFGNYYVREITVKKDGYYSQTIHPSKLKGAAYLNFIPYPLVNWIWGYFVDKKKVKCWKYKDGRDSFYFVLQKRK